MKYVWITEKTLNVEKIDMANLATCTIKAYQTGFFHSLFEAACAAIGGWLDYTVYDDCPEKVRNSLARAVIRWIDLKED